MSLSRNALAVGLLTFAALARAHGDEPEVTGAMNMDMESGAALLAKINMSDPDVVTYEGQYKLPSYAGLSQHQTMMMAHVMFEVLAWFFILPVGVVFSIARSKLALPVQILFLVLNGLGVVTGTTYNVSTPDLYVNNAHHSIGWIATWIMTAQVIMSVLFVYAGRTMKQEEKASFGERAAFLPPTSQSFGDGNARGYHHYRWSGDSGHGTESPSPTSSRQLSSSDIARALDNVKGEPSAPGDDEDNQSMQPTPKRPGFLRNNPIDAFLSTRMPQLLGSKVLFAIEVAYEVIDRTILILGFIALCTGGITYTGIFRSKNIFSGLAHFIKGGIFFWYGLLTLGRWMGCFADCGWAWNIKPTRSETGKWKSRAPSAEFVESFLIFLYGASNVFLEHLASWGGEWSAEDLEHISITIMFFGGGLLGMLVESHTVRRWLNASVDIMPLRSEVHPEQAQETRREPDTYGYSMNMVPALIILLLGIMMSSHHQDTVVSTKTHAMWGTLFAGASLSRGLTYVLMWLKPPTSIYPSRPPTELLTAFCLISGGIIFMSSAKDVMWFANYFGLMAMFMFTVTMGFTSFLMAYEILVLALKGWAVRREKMQSLSRH